MEVGKYYNYVDIYATFLVKTFEQFEKIYEPYRILLLV